MRNQNGFSLIGVLIATAILSIVGLTSLSMLKNMNDGQTGVKYSANVAARAEEIRAHLSTQGACLATFGNLNMTTNLVHNITLIRNADGTTQYALNTVDAEKAASIQKIELTVGTVAAGASTGDASLKVFFTPFIKGVNSSSKPREIIIAFRRNTVAPFALTSCIAKAKMTDGLWRRGGTVDDIFFSTGNVGIGTSNARSALDVKGVILTKPATANTTAKIDFSTGNIQYTTWSCGAFQLSNMLDGGSYTFAVQGATAGTCSFTATGAGGAALTMHLPVDHGISTTGKHTLYAFQVIGTHVYASWIPGY